MGMCLVFMPLLSPTRAKFLPAEVRLKLSITTNIINHEELDTNGIRVWDVKARRELPCSKSADSYGTISCAIWIGTKYASTETLCYGTVLGYLVFLRFNPATVSVVSGLRSSWEPRLTYWIRGYIRKFARKDSDRVSRSPASRTIPHGLNLVPVSLLECEIA